MHLPTCSTSKQVSAYEDHNLPYKSVVYAKTRQSFRAYCEPDICLKSFTYINKINLYNPAVNRYYLLVTDMKTELRLRNSY